MTGDRDIVGAVLAALLVLGLVGMVYVAVTPQRSGAAFTELYVLNESGAAADYPTDLNVGERATVLVGVGNHWPTSRTFSVDVTLDGDTVDSYDVSLSPGAGDRRPVSFAPADAGSQTLRVVLRTSEEGDPLVSVELTVHAR